MKGNKCIKSSGEDREEIFKMGEIKTYSYAGETYPAKREIGRKGGNKDCWDWLEGWDHMHFIFLSIIKN